MRTRTQSNAPTAPQDQPAQHLQGQDPGISVRVKLLSSPCSQGWAAGDPQLTMPQHSGKGTCQTF